MKKGGGIGPTKPWQPLQLFLIEKGANSDPLANGKDKLCEFFSLFFATIVDK